MTDLTPLKTQLAIANRDLSDLRAEYARLAYGIEVHFPNTVDAGIKALHAVNDALRIQIQEMGKDFEKRVQEEVERRLKAINAVQAQEATEFENQGLGDASTQKVALHSRPMKLGDQGIGTINYEGDSFREEEAPQTDQVNGSQSTTQQNGADGIDNLCTDIPRYGHCKRGRKCKMAHPKKITRR